MFPPLLRLLLTAGPAAPDYVQIPPDLFIGNRLLLERMSLAEVRRQGIKTIRAQTTSPDHTLTVIEHFDERGHTTYRRVWLRSGSGPGYMHGSGYSQFFACEYAPDGRLTAVSSFADSARQQVMQRFVYKYGARGQLRRAGSYQLRYYPNGLLQSVAGGGSTESYTYGSSGQLIRVEFGAQPGVLVCGNGTWEWRGQYNTARQLVTDTRIGTDEATYQLHYDAQGQLISRTSTDRRWHSSSAAPYECAYSYQSGLLAQTIEKWNGQIKQATTYVYERY